MPIENLPDIQSLSDDRNIPLDQVGVKNLRWPITVLDRRKGKQRTIATVNIYVNLPHNYRGTHMSRFVEVLNEYRDTDWLSRTTEILEQVRKIHDAGEAFMEITFEYFIEKSAPVSGQKSLMSYWCSFKASLGIQEDFILGVTVPVTTLCPCSKEISDFGAHNQRCTVTVMVRYKEFVWLEDLISLVEDSASGGLYTILKRPDEKYVTEHAYKKPMFVEDVVREITVKLNTMDNITWYKVEADSQESIHNHNAFARVERTKTQV